MHVVVRLTELNALSFRDAADAISTLHLFGPIPSQ